MKVKRNIWLVMGLVAACMACPKPIFADSKPPQHKLVVPSKVFHVDQVYSSMNGLFSEDKADFSQGQKSQLLWITGFKAEVIDPKTQKPMPWEHFCHSNLQFKIDAMDITKRNPVFGIWTNNDYKLVSLVQGKSEVNLPEGFGIPIYSDELLTSYTMVVNPDPKKKPFDIQVRCTYTYFKDSELKTPMKILVRRSVALWVPLTAAENAKKPKCFCDTEQAQPVTSTANNLLQGKEGSSLSYHWFVPPGKHRYKYIWGKGLKVPYDTTVHYIETHLHPYGTFSELRDKTAGKTLFKAWAKNAPNGLSIAAIDHKESKAGIPFYSSHEYELICEYDNKTKKDVDAMGMFYFYYSNK